MVPKIRAVAFDLDNTLLNFFEAKEVGCKGAAKEFVSQYGGSTRKVSKELLEMYIKFGIESDNIFTEFLRMRIGQADTTVLNKMIRSYLKEKNKVLSAYPGVLRTLRTLRRNGLKLAILTDAGELKALKRIKRTKILKYFDVIQTYTDSGFWKPDRRAFSLFLSKLKLKPQEVLFVGDIPKRDIKGAKMIGMRTAFAKYGWLKKYFPIGDDSDKAEFILKKPEDLLTVIMNLL